MSPAASLEELVDLGYPSPSLTHQDIRVTRTRALGTSAWLAYQPDHDEIQRRKAFSLGAVLDWDLLDTLMDLPAGLPVPLASLTKPERRRVTSASPGVARIIDGEVIRDLVPTLTPLLAIVKTSNWEGGLVRASRFASYCPRMVYGPAVPASPWVLDRALQFGIGVAIKEGPAPVKVLLEPEPVVDWQPTTAWWRFCETVSDRVNRP